MKGACVPLAESLTRRARRRTHRAPGRTGSIPDRHPAQEFGSLKAYVGWLIDQPISAAPLERAVRAAMRGQPRDAVREAAHQTVRDAVFLVELVIRLNGAAVELTRIEGLRYAAL